jgi:hypothetical protein
MDQDKDTARECPVFGVESGGAVIGLGILLILFVIVPLVAGRVSIPLPLVLLFTGFGLFLIWIGITR